MMAEKCRVEDPRNSLALLEKASHCVEQAIQRIPHDGDNVSCCVQLICDILCYSAF